MAGFRMGRGRGNARSAQQQERNPAGAPGTGPVAFGPGPAAYGGQPRRQQPPQTHAPYGTTGGFGPGPRAAQQWPGATRGGAPGRGEPEYLGGGPEPLGPGPAPAPGHPQASGPYAGDAGQTRAFQVPDPYGPDDGYPPGGDAYGAGSTYTAGRTSAPASGPRLGWTDLLRGIVLRPNATFWQMRDYPVWGTALAVTFVYGLLAVFGLDEERESVIGATLGNAIPYVLITGVAVVVAGLILGAVTHTLARQFGGDGAWAPTIGLSMLIMCLTDAPRLVFALFLGGTAPLVQVLGWVTWIAAGALFASMVSRSHDLPWPKALGASSIQLLALLFLIKLGTL